MPFAQENIELFNSLLAENTAGMAAKAHIDFDQFRAFTDLHHLSGYLYIHIKGTPAEDFFPPEFLAHLGKRYSQQQQRCNDTLREAALIHDAFRAAHLDVLFLKGPFVAQQFYGNSCQRFYMDIDIMVSREDVREADQLLRNIGFSKLSLVLVSNDVMTRFTHTADYHKRIAEDAQPPYRNILPLDLHWSLRSHFAFRLDYENIWKQQEECLLDGRQFPVLSTEYTLVLNVLGILFDIELGLIRLKSFLDLYKMLEVADSGMNWDAFFEKRAQENISVISLSVLDLVLSVLDCRSRFPGVALYIEKNRRLIRLTDSYDKYRLLKRSQFALNNRRWAYTLYQAPVLQSFLWTIISLPFRIAAHERAVQRIMGRMR